MIPNNSNIKLEELEVVPYANKTYKVNLQEGRIDGYVDGAEAVKQAISKILNTERFAYEIYNDQYGNELETLIGKDYLFVKNDIRRIIEEALLADDRVIAINDFTMSESTVNLDSVTVSFVVTTNSQELVVVQNQEVKIR